MKSRWDITALLNAADAKAELPSRHLWLVRLLEWLRHAPRTDAATPTPVLRLRHLLNLLDQHPEHREQVQAMLQAFWREVDAVTLLADYGFGARMSLRSEVVQRLRERILPGTPATTDGAELFALIFEPGDADWIDTLDADTLHRLALLMGPAAQRGGWQRIVLEAITMLLSSVRAMGFSPGLRRRMSPALLTDEPFHQIPHVAERLRAAVLAGERNLALQEARYLRALLDSCRRATESVAEHLEEHGVSVDIVYTMDQLAGRVTRAEGLIDIVLAPDPAEELRGLMRALLAVNAERRSMGAMIGRHYSQLARLVAERNAETGEHYITRTGAEYADMFRRACGGGFVIAGTTFVKFAVTALALGAFWSGVWAGVNYALSFVLIMLLHWTVATKQPAMTAPAMATRLREATDDAGIEAFVDEIAHLVRSQSAGIFGNLLACAPVVLAVQAGVQALWGRPLVGAKEADYVVHNLSLLGPTPLYAAFTGVLLFGSSLIAGWIENAFVFHRLDSAIAWNPAFVRRLGSARAQRWSRWWRLHISGLAANVSLGLMLGLVPALFAIVGLPVEVRHVTLSTGQLAAALGAKGLPLLGEAAFWWCMAGIAVTAVLNLTVSFVLAFRVALRSRGIRLHQRRRIYAAIRRRLWRRPFSFLIPPFA